MVRAFADQHQPGVRDPREDRLPRGQQDVLPLLPAQPPHTDHQRAVPAGAAWEPYAVDGLHAAAHVGRVAQTLHGIPAEAVEVDAVRDHRPLPADPAAHAPQPLRLAHAHRPRRPPRPPPLPAERERRGGPADRLERPGVRLENGRDPPAYGEPGRETGLRAVRVHQVGLYVLDHAGEPPYLRHQRRTRRPRRRPVPHVGAQRPESGREAPLGTGDRDAQPGGELSPRQVRHDTGDPAVHRLGDMQNPWPGVGRWQVHTRFLAHGECSGRA